MARRSHPLLRGLTYVFALVLVPLLAGGMATLNRLRSWAQSDTTPPPYTGVLPAPPPHDPARPTAVVLAANSGTEGSDFLAPYGVLATSGAFNLYAVAPERRITHLFPGSPLMRGVDMVPHYGFAAYDATIGVSPDLIVIPFMPFKEAPEYQTILAWIRAHTGPETIVLSICAGATNLADTGLLAGRSATTHHYTFPEIAAAHPDITLIGGVRYVEDGNLISSAGVTAGVDATLFTLQRLLGRDAAHTVANELAYPYAQFLDDPTYAPPVSALANLGGTAPPLHNIAIGSSRPAMSQLGVALSPGMSELALASVVDTYPHEGVVNVQTVAPERAPIVSEHGLTLIPRWGFAEAPRLNRLILPGNVTDADVVPFARWAEAQAQPEVETIHAAGGYPYDVTFTDLARRAGRVVAGEAVYLLEYPLAELPADAPPYTARQLAPILALALLGVLIVAAAKRLPALFPNTKSR